MYKSKKYTLIGSGFLAIMMALPVNSFSFGGEDIFLGGPWHHEDMTFRALVGDGVLYDSVINKSSHAYKRKVFHGVGFTPKAGYAVAWTADNIDGYLYSPIFMAKAGRKIDKRLKAAMTTYADLVKLHHDDTFTSVGVQENWDRYLSGTLAGLYLAAEQDDVAAAYNILGVSVHAMQDFYSHSNWIDDPARRKTTWFDASNAARSRGIYTGAYELPARQAPAHHGAYSMSCSMTHGSAYGVGLQSVYSGLCSGLSPMQNASICESYRACENGAVTPIKLATRKLDNVVRTGDIGISIDSAWQAEVHGQHRKLIDRNKKFMPTKGTRQWSQEVCTAIVNFEIPARVPGLNVSVEKPRSCEDDSDYLFADTKYLAMKSTGQWMQIIGKAMKEMGPKQEKFWQGVKNYDMKDPSTPPKDTQIPQFENFGNMPFQFLSAGPYPVQNAANGSGHGSTSHGWYLRVKLKTSNDLGSGTDADIKVKVNNYAPILLDYLPTSDAAGRTDSSLFVYNDFEAGDNDVYIIGPFTRQPKKIKLINDAADNVDVVIAAWDDIGRIVESGFAHSVSLAKGIIGGGADYVGTESQSIDHDTIKRALGSNNGVVERSLTIDGGTNGEYKVHYKFTKNPSQSKATQEYKDGWREYIFKPTKLHCVDESDVEIGFANFADEPYVFISVTPFNGQQSAKVSTYKFGPFDDVDDGESFDFKGAGPTYIKLPPQGRVTFSAQIWEEDLENDEKLASQYRTFKTGVSENARKGNLKFFDALASSTFSDWKLDRIEIAAFSRGKIAQVGGQYKKSNIGWIEAGKSRTFTLPHFFKALPLPDQLHKNGMGSNNGGTVIMPTVQPKEAVVGAVRRNSSALTQTVQTAPPVSSTVNSALAESASSYNSGTATTVVQAAPSATYSAPPMNTVPTANASGYNADTAAATVVQAAPSAVYSGPLVSMVPVAPTANAVPNWTGVWSTDFGKLDLKQSGTHVTGSYKSVGTIDAQYDSKKQTLSGTFTNAGRVGDFIFTLGGDKFTGQWKWASAQTYGGKWNGSRESTKAQKTPRYKR